MTHDKGFDITDDIVPKIFRNGIEVFKSKRLYPVNLDEAKALIDYSLESKSWHEWNVQRYGNTVRMPLIEPDGHTEASEEELRRAEDWVSQQAEQDLYRHEL
jgi:hypothetical protein